MPKFTNETLDGWRKPASENEEQKISNAIDMIKDAVKNHRPLKDKDIEFIIQGSYGNNTNIKLDSDVDVCVMLKDSFFSKYRDGASSKDYGFTEGTNSYADFKKDIVDALNSKFGKENVTVGNKSIKIKSNTYRVHADAVPSFQFRNYRFETKNDPKNFYEGIKFIATDGEEVINYPKLHVKEGIAKNDKTLRRYKRTVRLYKKIKNKMIEDGVPVSGNIRSFLIEGLLWNLPDATYSIAGAPTWNDILKSSITYLYNNTKTDELCSKWVEVSGMFYLFHSERKWNRQDTNAFLLQMWKYLEY